MWKWEVGARGEERRVNVVYFAVEVADGRCFAAAVEVT
jgi:hypothetical protein